MIWGERQVRQVSHSHPGSLHVIAITGVAGGFANNREQQAFPSGDLLYQSPR